VITRFFKCRRNSAGSRLTDASTIRSNSALLKFNRFMGTFLLLFSVDVMV
jgi:hypothetical protein